jgi:hypothetical protein
MASKISVTRLPKTNTLILRQSGGKDFFVSSDDVIVTDVVSLAFILKFLIANGYLPIKVVEGILSELKE